MTSWGNVPATRELTAHAHLRRTSNFGPVTGGPDTELPWQEMADGATDADGAAWVVGQPTRAVAKVAGTYLATYGIQGGGTALRAYLRQMTSAGVHKRYGGQHASDPFLNVHIAGASVFDMLADEYIVLWFYLVSTDTVTGPGVAGNPVGSYLTLARLD